MAHDRRLDYVDCYCSNPLCPDWVRLGKRTKVGELYPGSDTYLRCYKCHRIARYVVPTAPVQRPAPVGEGAHI
jgi:hypothetical protein